MKIDDDDYKEILALLPREGTPDDPTEARQAVENFVDLVELIMRPLPLPPAKTPTPKQPSLNRSEASSPPLPPTESTSEVPGRDSSIGFEHR